MSAEPVRVGAEPLDSAGVQLADRIAREVSESGASAGAVVASEAELLARHGVGRPVLRQAVRILEERGVAFMRRGHRGGLVVSAPTPDAASRSLSILIESMTDDLQPLSVLPMAVDSHLFMHCAPRLSLTRCEELRRLVRKLDRLSDEDFLRTRAHRQLHHAIRTALDEPAVALANKTSTEYIVDLMPYSIDVMMEGSKGDGWRFTCETVEALIAGDTPRLFEMRRLQMEIILASWPDWASIERDPSMAPKVSDRDRPEFRASGHQADRLAREILREVRLMNWEPGARIGGAAELMERYGAGSDTLRQAVRMLQEHSAVEVGRGRKGGLFIATPDRKRAVERAQAYVRQTGSRPAEVESFLVTLMLEALENRRGQSFDPLRRPGGERPDHLSGVAARVAALCRCPPLEIFAEVLAPFLPRRRLQGSPDALWAALVSSDRPWARRILLAGVYS